jgi:hypothetical protein
MKQLRAKEWMLVSRETYRKKRRTYHGKCLARYDIDSERCRLQRRKLILEMGPRERRALHRLVEFSSGDLRKRHFDGQNDDSLAAAVAETSSHITTFAMEYRGDRAI